MKILKITFSIIIVILICVAAYMVFFDFPGKVKAIMEKHEKGKSIFESKIKVYKAKEEILEKEILVQDQKIEEAIKNYENTLTTLKKLQEDYEDSSRPVNPQAMKDLEECRGLYSTLTETLKKSENLTVGTQKALSRCNQLRLFQESQINNFKSGMILKNEIIKTQKIEIKRLNLTISDLYKAKKPKIWKYITFFLAGGIIVAVLK